MKQEVSSAYWQVIWSRFQSGNQEAFAILYNHHIQMLYSYGTKLCKDEEAVKDSLQELFMDLYLRKNKIRIDVDNLKYYLLLSLKRSLIKKMQADKKFKHHIDESLDFKPEYSIEFQIMEHETDQENRLKILNALNQLPPKQKEAVYLRYNESLEYHEVANILNVTVESVRKQVYRALKTVRDIIDNQSITILFSFFSKKH
jgi:RNA polymerase sigma factor (sigma-70 family)